jgi:hypothetical protein
MLGLNFSTKFVIHRSGKYLVSYCQHVFERAWMSSNNAFLQKKSPRCIISQIYFDKELYMFRIDLLSIIRSLNTVFTAIGICHTSYVDCLLARS